MAMELLQLKYFQKVAHLEHMTKAAQELCVAQPSLSKTIKLLEQELGTPLFDRNGKYIKLNSYGRAYLRKIDMALALLEDGKRELEDMKNREFKTINLTFLAASPLIPDILSSFSEKYPNVKFNLRQNLPPYLSHDFDLCISCLPLRLEGINSTPLITEKFFLAVPYNHPLAKRTGIKLEEVSRENFISLKPGNAIREITDNFCQLAGFTPRVIFESDNPATVRGLISAGQGVGFIPAVSWCYTKSSPVRLLEIEEPLCNRTLGISLIEQHYHSDVVLLFHQFTIDYFKKLTGQ